MLPGDVNLKKSIISLAKLPDLIVSKLYLRLFQEKNSLIIFNFHGLFRNEGEINLNLVDPQTWITIDQFRQFVEYFLNHNYIFVSPEDILEGLSNNRKYIMITFDDGYYNNKYALSILKKYQIPALFFPSTNHIIHNKCFWWDVLYRERKKMGTSEKDILHEQNQLKSKASNKTEHFLIDIFGEKAFKPISDIDRPFTTSELRDFTKEKYVFLGNHTSNHAILTNYSLNGIKSQILDAQNAIQDITGITPTAISYPNGNYSDEVIKISKDIGINLGITVDYRKNKLPINQQDNNSMRLGRFDISCSNNIIKQCELFRSDILLYAWVWYLLSKNKQKRSVAFRFLQI